MSNLGNQSRDTCGQNSHWISPLVCQGVATHRQEVDVKIRSFIQGKSKLKWGDFLSGSLVKTLPANAGDTGNVGAILGQEDPLEEGIATHSSILAMDRGAWQTTVHGVTKSWTWLKGLSMYIVAATEN